jgi:8-oxo-dGTP diphosphatase
VIVIENKNTFMTNPVHEFYGNRLRARTCGLYVEDDRLLLVNHDGLGKDNFWSPPGGGVEFGESLSECLTREFHEETGLEVIAKEFLFLSEFIAPPLHAIEFFFLVKKTGGQLKTGKDPEMNYQIIKEIRFVSWSEIKTMSPESLHGIFKKVPEPSKIMDLRGHFKL